MDLPTILVKAHSQSITKMGGGDIIWQISTGYFGCRTKAGTFDAAVFKKIAQDPQIKMIEIKLSQGAKPGAWRNAYGAESYAGNC